jgi:cytoskeletal protein RodZ
MIKYLCQQLKQKRQDLGYSLEEVVEKTKLHPSVIKDIEAGDLDKISPVYLKGFIKIYASFLGVKLGDHLQELEIKAKPKSKPQPKPKTAIKQSYNREQQKHSRKKELRFRVPAALKRKIAYSLLALVLGLIIFSLVAAVVRLIKGSFSGTDKPAKTETASSDSAPTATPSVTSSSTEPKATTQEVSSALAQADKITTSVRIKRPVHIRVKQDGEIVYAGVLQAGAIETWQAQEKLDLKISDGSSVEVEVNGQLLPPLSKIHRPIKSLKITDQGISIEK